MQENVVETKMIKTEITCADEIFSLCSSEMRNTGSVMVVVKNEGIVADHADSGSEENIIFKSEDIKGTQKCDFIRYESFSLFEMPANVTTTKYEIKSEEMDVSYPTLDFKKNVEASETDTVTFGKYSSGNRCDSDNKESEKQWRKINVNQLSPAASKATQRGKDMSFSCFHCDYSTNFKRCLVRHMLLHDKSNTKLFSCTNCDYSTRYKHALVRHTIKVHSGNKYPCTYCEKHFKEKKSLDNHIKKDHQHFMDSVSSKTHNYLTYDYKTTRKVNLKRHTIRVHSGNYENSCTSCERRFTSKRSLYNHIIKNHQNFTDLVNIKVHSCPTCDYKTAVKGLLNRHMSIVHSGNYSHHSCRCCEKHFKAKSSLDDHIIKNHQNFINFVSSKVHNCQTCDYKTTNKYHLRSHIIRVHSENYEKHSCTDCEKHFKEKKSLDDHIIKNHQNFINSVSSKVHNCQTCDYKTTNKSHLKSHIRVHSENYEKHSCTHCEKHFKEKKSLDDHIIKNHKNFIGSVSSKIYSCPSCDYKTTRSDSLRGHMKVHPGSYEKHSCAHCEKDFKEKKSLDNHLMKYHQNAIDSVSSTITQHVSIKQQ